MIRFSVAASFLLAMLGPAHPLSRPPHRTAEEDKLPTSHAWRELTGEWLKRMIAENTGEKKPHVRGSESEGLEIDKAGTRYYADRTLFVTLPASTFTNLLMDSLWDSLRKTLKKDGVDLSTFGKRDPATYAGAKKVTAKSLVGCYRIPKTDCNGCVSILLVDGSGGQGPILFFSVAENAPHGLPRAVPPVNAGGELKEPIK